MQSYTSQSSDDSKTPMANVRHWVGNSLICTFTEEYAEEVIDAIPLSFKSDAATVAASLYYTHDFWKVKNRL